MSFPRLLVFHGWVLSGVTTLALVPVILPAAVALTQLRDTFITAAHNVGFIAGTGTDKTHLSTALGVSGIT